jgi:hypothetical protein
VLAMLVVMAILGAIGYLMDRPVDQAEGKQDQPIPESDGRKPVGSLHGSKGEQC